MDSMREIAERNFRASEYLSRKKKEKTKRVAKLSLVIVLELMLIGFLWTR